ncbi:thiamine phosphate synthase [Pedobacter sp. MC2016-15]|uniref:thiamine phosphate synthase n=1 Tax=Pedobacter sp. MC2016-15 TaxID=2994473 RepID=UPI002246DEDF|nr:thiamine phosphate synthase [Pedobacter sp. MC2016-15]MCX2480087.1 thiamine phosphate synthase [Pedobacter sp. MC2016-15]
MELIVVTPPAYFEEEAALINQFFAEGLQLLHLRKEMNDPGQFRVLMDGIDPGYYPRIAIHQHHELAMEFGLKRLHYKEAERRALLHKNIARLRDDGFYLSSSVHDLEEISSLEGFNYVFYGPVFNSISKAGYETVLPGDFILPAHKVKVFAIGGVEEGKLAQLKQMNFDGAAVLGSLWHQAASPLTALKSLLKSIKNDYR